MWVRTEQYLANTETGVLIEEKPRLMNPDDRYDPPEFGATDLVMYHAGAETVLATLSVEDAGGQAGLLLDAFQNRLGTSVVYGWRLSHEAKLLRDATQEARHPDAAPEECGMVFQAHSGSGAVNLRCTLPRGHEGAHEHRQERTDSAPPQEPKPLVTQAELNALMVEM